MRRLRVTATMRRRFDALTDGRGNARKGGVMLVPRILSCEEWEQLAAIQQDTLLASSAEDRGTPMLTTAHEPDDVAIQREHERLYQEYRKKAGEGGLSLVRANEKQVRSECINR